MRRSFILVKNPIAIAFMVLSLCSVLIVPITTLRLPELTVGVEAVNHQTSIIRMVPKDNKFGKFGEMMTEMILERGMKHSL